MINDKQIEHLGKLARLQITEEDKEKLRSQVSDILDFVSQLQKVDTKGVEPTFYVSQQQESGRADEDKLSEHVEELNQAMPESSSGYLKSPNVFK